MSEPTGAVWLFETISLSLAASGEVLSTRSQLLLQQAPLSRSTEILKRSCGHCRPVTLDRLTPIALSITVVDNVSYFLIYLENSHV